MRDFTWRRLKSRHTTPQQLALELEPLKTTVEKQSMALSRARARARAAEAEAASLADHSARLEGEIRRILGNRAIVEILNLEEKSRKTKGLKNGRRSNRNRKYA